MVPIHIYGTYLHIYVHGIYVLGIYLCLWYLSMCMVSISFLIEFVSVPLICVPRQNTA
jgi:hypothetical protein